MFKCHGIDDKGKQCENSVGIMRHFFKGVCLECEIEIMEMRLKEMKLRLKREKRFRRA
jgi:hypothetical protein